VISESQNAIYVFEKPPSGWTNMTETTKLTATAGLRGRLIATEGTISYLQRESPNTTK